MVEGQHGAADRCSERPQDSSESKPRTNVEGGQLKSWELSVLACAGIGLVVALVCIIFMQQAAISELRTRMNIMEVAVEAYLAPLERRIIHLTTIAEEINAQNPNPSITAEAQAPDPADPRN